MLGIPLRPPGGGGSITVFSTVFNEAVYCHMLSHWTLTLLKAYILDHHKPNEYNEIGITATTSGSLDLPPGTLKPIHQVQDNKVI